MAPDDKETEEFKREPPDIAKINESTSKAIKAINQCLNRSVRNLHRV